MDTIVQVEGLRKTYGATVAVDEVSFEVREGEIFGMVGPNGAGKTTTIECLEGLRKPDRGTIRVLGLDPQRENQTLRERTGMQLQQSNLPERMKVWEALDLYSSFYPRATDWEALLVQLGLEEKRNAPFSKLSGGQKQRLFIALALLPDPQLVFLAELTTGLDPQARHAIWDLVRDVRSKGKTILMTTHFMEEAERLCDRVAILDHGCIVALDTPEALIRSLGAEERIVFSLDEAMTHALEKALSESGQAEIQGERVTVHGNNNRQTALVSEMVNQLTVSGIKFRDLRTEQPNLEDVFLKLTGRDMKE
ncbi:MAG: ABC transporter ATP-binding protein [Chloroflexi bacterium]|nr:ABC transporter ATP-binding protein [Chloroflexota bacterium]